MCRSYPKHLQGRGRGKPVPHLLHVADQAAREAEALERALIGHRVDTDGCTIEEITDMVVALTDGQASSDSRRAVAAEPWPQRSLL